MLNSILSHLTDRAVLAITGEDARGYLQGLITNDIRKVTPEKAIFAALLSPQGKYLFEFFIIEQKGVLLLETDKARLPELIKRLSMYKLRAKVEFEERSDLQVAASWENERITSHESQLVFDDPRHPALGQRILFQKVIPAKAGIEDYETHRLSLGIPEGGKELIVDRSLLLEFGYDHLNAIDFAKGCYVGQEVTARSKHRASLHKYIHCVSAETSLPPVGTPVIQNGKEIGELRSSHGTVGLALLRIEEASRGNLLAAELPIRVSLPTWIASA